MGRSNQKGKTSEVLMQVVGDLKRVSREKKSRIWREIAERLESPGQNWAVVNLDKASSVLKEGEVGVVAGKVLGNGRVRRGLVLAAYSFSKSAREKLQASGGKALSLRELADTNPKGSKVRILG
jgi:large subunit ribosomal protein L18e